MQTDCHNTNSLTKILILRQSVVVHSCQILYISLSLWSLKQMYSVCSYNKTCILLLTLLYQLEHCKIVRPSKELCAKEQFKLFGGRKQFLRISQCNSCRLDSRRTVLDCALTFWLFMLLERRHFRNNCLYLCYECLSKCQGLK